MRRGKTLPPLSLPAGAAAPAGTGVLKNGRFHAPRAAKPRNTRISCSHATFPSIHNPCISDFCKRLHGVDKNGKSFSIVWKTIGAEAAQKVARRSVVLVRYTYENVLNR